MPALRHQASPHDTRPDAIVIFRLGSLGDTIVALPCFHAVLRRFPHARRALLTNVPVSSKAAPVLGVLGSDGQFVDTTIEYPLGMRSLGGLLAVRRSLRAFGARKLVYLMPERRGLSAWRDWVYFRLCGFTEILAFPADPSMRHSLVDAHGVEEPEASRLARCCTPDFGPVDLSAAASWDLRLTPAERARGREAVAHLGAVPHIAINMGGKGIQKDWGVPNWTSLMARLAARWPGLALVTVGAGDDRSRADALLVAWPGPTANLCGTLTPRECAAALGDCAGFIGHDSGPMHLAAAMGVPTLGLFGDYNRPAKWHPMGPSVAVIHKMEGLATISPDDAERAAVALFGARVEAEMAAALHEAVSANAA
ncbi:glycosyltransferase family 9 protein [Cupriavidus agavae]|uniref:ADP-heptose:LPS heptosyltransferase n=1 Tax=Cupriavidus agavae TaxID=1001822 RepID=A0A4Q7S5X6_9BURK|nr:glycosyltransferase family 9 protein [Cupriavidus agavae]RZT41771.1 ADP-heptose:LPS heptosyltransferase [Cupriavidus agavae]